MSVPTAPCTGSSKAIRIRRFSAGLLSLLFFITAAPLYAAEVVEIVISGIEGDALNNVQKTLALPAGLAQEGVVDRLWLERFARQSEAKTRSALEPFGFYNPQVTTTVEPDGTHFRLLVVVTAGQPVRLGEVIITLTGQGAEEYGLISLTEAFPLKKGDILLHQQYEEAKRVFITTALQLGFPDAKWSRHELRINPAAGDAAIKLVLDTGNRYYFGATSIIGAPDYPDSFLRRHLTYASGEHFSYASLGETQRNFTNSERFKTVIINPEKQDAANFMIPTTIMLTPGPRISVGPGIGYGTDTGARFTIRYRDVNMFHQGHELYANLYLAERLQGLVTGYSIPDPRDVRSSTTLQLNLQQEDTATYESRIVALELARNRSFGAGKLGTAYVKAQLEEYTVGNEEATARLLLPGLRFSDNRYDNPVRPTRGFRYAFDVHGTHQWLGSDTELVQVLAEGSYLLPLPWRLSLHTRAKAGTTFFNDPLRDIPPSLRFFTGGDQSVRGYSYKSLGPRDASGRVVGGTQLLTGSVELERAIFKDWGVSVFYDAGNSFNSYSSVTLFQGAGIGLHYFTQVGALNLSVARPVGSDKSSIHIHFTVGFEL